MRYLLFMILVCSTAFAQEDVVQPEAIQTDRPDQTETPALVPAGMFQMENGFSLEENGDAQMIVAPSSLFKYGINENFELRLIAEYATLKLGGEKFSGLAPVLIGFKARIAEEKGIWPKTSFIGHMSIPKLASEDFKGDFYAPEFRFVMQHTLSEDVSFSYNLGAEWDGFTPEPAFIYTIATGFGLTDKFGAFVELYGFARQEGKPDHRFDGGLTYLISHNFMIDFSAGGGITQNAPDYFAAFGFSFRL